MAVDAEGGEALEGGVSRQGEGTEEDTGVARADEDSLPIRWW